VTSTDQSGRYARFAEFEFDRQACELSRSGHRVPLQIQPARVLEILLDRAGDIVTRAELRAKIWPATITVDFDHGLNNAITRLRHALGDTADAARFVETVPRVGYRFVHPIEDQEPAESQPAAVPGWHKPQFTARTAVMLVSLMAAIPFVFWLVGEDQQTADTVIVGKATVNAEAYEAYLRGLEAFERRSKESNKLSIDYLERATELDRDFAPAFAALAMAYASAGGRTTMQYASPAEVATAAVAAVQRALQLDPKLARAHLALAHTLNQLQPWSMATDIAIEQSFLRAEQLDPLDSDICLQYGNFLASRDRGEEAIQRFRRAWELNPLSPSINSRLGMELFANGKTSEGIEFLEKTVELDPFQYNARLRLGWMYLALNDLGNAGEAFDVAEQISPHSLWSLAGQAYVAARTGDTNRAQKMLQTVLPDAEQMNKPFAVAIIYVGLGDRENAIAWLQRTTSESRMLSNPSPWSLNTPLYDSLRDDARFVQIEQELATQNRPGPVELQAL